MKFTQKELDLIFVNIDRKTREKVTNKIIKKKTINLMNRFLR